MRSFLDFSRGVIPPAVSPRNWWRLPSLLVLALVAVACANVTATLAGVFTNANGTLSITNQPASVTLAWDYSPEPTAAGYRLYWGPTTRGYTRFQEAGRTNATTVSPLTRGLTNFFAVTVYLTNGLESDFSSEVNYAAQVLPAPPPNTHTLYFTVEATTDFKGWVDVDNYSLPVWADRQFLRLRIVSVK